MKRVFEFREDIKHQNIWISGTESFSLSLFSQLISDRIYVHGFVDDEKKGMQIFNKPVCSKKDVLKIGGEILDPYDNKWNYLKEQVPRNKQIYIWGAGKVGRQLHKIFIDRNYNFKAFIDIKNQELDISGYRCLKPEVIQELPKSSVIILAGKNYRDMKLYMDNNYISIDCYYWDYPLDEIKDIYVNDDIKWNLGGNILYICEICENKVILASNDDKKFKYFKEILELLGFKVLICDDYVKKKNHIWVMSKECGELKKYCEKSKLKFLDDYIILDEFRIDIYSDRKNIIDMNLGYTFLHSVEYPGFYILRNCELNDAEEKIVILGNSTSDITAYTFSNWTQIFYEKISKKEKVVLYCGGVSGYTTTQEMLKLIRDVVNIRPNKVITYTGIVDAAKKVQTSYSCGTLKKINAYVNQNFTDEIADIDFSENNNEYAFGIQKCKSRFENMIDNLRIMHAVAEEFNIKFYAFLQPMLGNKKRNFKEEALWTIVKNNLSEDALDAMHMFRKSISNIKLSYIYDLSDIFDDIHDVFYDEFHIWEHGNRIVADKIYETLYF